jgi:hypothetical protein
MAFRAELLDSDLSAGPTRQRGVSSVLVSAVCHLLLVFVAAITHFSQGIPFTAALLMQFEDREEAPEALLQVVVKPQEEEEHAVAVEVPEASLDIAQQANVFEFASPPVDHVESHSVSLASSLPLDMEIGKTEEKADVTFFGTSASGRDFIFILDCSGSMQARDGGRFHRAREELVQSLSMLRPEQRFYVFLFNWSTIPMFGPVENPGKLVEATPDNIEKLRAWLYTVLPVSGTDPRRSLAESLRMKPDAIFLLSDGAFNTPGVSDPLLGWDSSKTTVFDVVGHKDAAKIPIHTVAFEDPVAAVGMQRLAEQVEGQFRFVPVPGRENLPRFAASEEDIAEYEPSSPEEQKRLAADILLLRRAERLVSRKRHEEARNLVASLEAEKLPRDLRRRLAAIRQ